MYHPMFKRLSKGLLIALLLLILTGCATRTEYVRELPPVELLADCTETVSDIKTNGQLASAYLAAKDDLAKCNIDKRSLREWAKQ